MMMSSDCKKNIAVVVNPAAGRANGVAIAQEFCAHLENASFKYHIFETTHPGHARELAAESISGFDVIAGIGGDGTINEIINGLADSSSQTPLLPVPAGTANVVARELGLPLTIDGAAKMLGGYSVRKIDLGLVHSRRFAMCAGVGFDANIVRKVSQWRGANGITMFDYVVPFFEELFSYPFPQMEVIVDGQVACTDCTFAVIGNMRQYGGPFGFFNDAEVDDGYFEICCFRGRSWLSLLSLGVKTLLRILRSSDQALILKGRDIKINCQEKVAMQVDGDCGECLPAHFEVLPKAVGFCVPGDN